MTEIDWMTSCSNRLISHYGYDGETADRTARDAAEEQAYLYGSDPAAGDPAGRYRRIITRCDGRITTSPSGFGTVSVGQAECLRCLRRTAERGEYVWLMEPPQFVDGKCPSRIEP